MKTAFFGSAGFGERSLAMLIKCGYDITAVVTQPDRGKGRGHKITASAVKLLAEEYNAKGGNALILQPEKAKEEWFIDKMSELKPDLFVTASYGNFLPQRLLDIPRLGCINVHGSLLPELRGAAPIQWAVIRGYTKTGVTTMFTDIGMDSGDILLKSETDITDDMTYGELYEILSIKGAELLRETLEYLADNRLIRKVQDNALVTFAPLIKKEFAKIDFTRSAKEVRNLIRGMNPTPTAYVVYNGINIKIFKADIFEGKVPDIKPGTVFTSDGKTLNIACGDGAVTVKMLQAPSGKCMTADAYLRGHNIPDGAYMGG